MSINILARCLIAGIPLDKGSARRNPIDPHLHEFRRAAKQPETNDQEI